MEGLHNYFAEQKTTLNLYCHRCGESEKSASTTFIELQGKRTGGHVLSLQCLDGKFHRLLDQVLIIQFSALICSLEYSKS